MEMIQTEKLVYEYEKRDEEGNVIGTSRAIDGVDIEAKKGSLQQFSDIMVPENQLLPSI